MVTIKPSREELAAVFDNNLKLIQTFEEMIDLQNDFEGFDVPSISQRLDEATILAGDVSAHINLHAAIFRAFKNVTEAQAEANETAIQNALSKIGTLEAKTPKYRGASWQINGGGAEAATVISTVNTPVLAAGTTTYADKDYFTEAGDNNLTYAAKGPIKVECTAIVNIAGGSGDDLHVWFRHYDNAAASYNDMPKSIVNLGSGTVLNNVAVSGFATLNYNDRVELWVENTSDTDNITIKDKTHIQVTQRAFI